VTPTPILHIEDLRVRYGASEVVKGLDLDLASGEVAAVVGESGSGKSQAMLAVLRLLSPEAQVSGKILLRDIELLSLPDAALNCVRGKRIAMIFQDPKTALDPYTRVGQQIGAVLARHTGLSRAKSLKRAAELLDLVGIAEPQRRVRAYPHELSGGQRQRVAIAMAISCNPDILIADEPTTALDVTVEARIIALLGELKVRLNMALIFISHDLALVRQFADTIHVMKDGEKVESGAAATLCAHPQQAYTQSLFAAMPQAKARQPNSDAPVLLKADNITVCYPLPGGFLMRRKEIKAVDDVSLSLREGETLGLVGESGSGKSTLGRALLKLVPFSGHVSFEDRDLAPLSQQAMRPLRRGLQLVFQDPFSSLSPRQKISDIVTEGLRIHEPHIAKAERIRLAEQALAEVGLESSLLERFPHELSGGQRQRVAIARVLILKPKLVVLDEPTSALDRSVQADILKLLAKLQTEHGLTYVLISHDLGAVEAMADQLAVMKDGKLVEQGPAIRVLANPQADYTKSLLAAALLKKPTVTDIND